MGNPIKCKFKLYWICKNILVYLYISLYLVFYLHNSDPCRVGMKRRSALCNIWHIVLLQSVNRFRAPFMFMDFHGATFFCDCRMQDQQFNVLIYVIRVYEFEFWFINFKMIFPGYFSFKLHTPKECFCEKQRVCIFLPIT